MPISYIDQASAASNTTTWPTHQAGDLLLVIAHRNAPGAPTLPTGYTTVQSATGNDNGLRIGYRIAAGSGTAFGTWTNANRVVGLVYRGASGVGASSANTQASGGSKTIPALTLQNTSGTSWHVSSVSVPDGGAIGAISGMTQRTYTGGNRTLVVDSNGGVVTTGTQTASTVNSPTGAVASLELLEGGPVEPPEPTGSGGSFLPFFA